MCFPLETRKLQGMPAGNRTMSPAPSAWRSPPSSGVPTNSPGGRRPAAEHRAPEDECPLGSEFGAPGWTRTSGPELRRLVLYPPELRARYPMVRRTPHP